jgi:hypothetical protein
MDFSTIGLIIVALITTGAGLLGPIINYQQNKNKAEVAKTYHDLLLIETKRNARLWETNNKYRRGIEKLTTQLLGKGIVPCWTMPKEKENGN